MTAPTLDESAAATSDDPAGDSSRRARRWAALPGQVMPGGNTPSRWSWTHLDVDKASQLWDELVDFVVWLDARYLSHQSGPTLRFKACWYRHPVVVEELTALLAAWQDAYCPPGKDPATDPVDNSPTDALTRWHQYALWPTLQRLREYAGWSECGPDGHRLRDTRYDPDLKAGLDEFLAADLASRPEPAPTALADAAVEHDAAVAILAGDDVDKLLRAGTALALLPDDPASPLYIDGGWWAQPSVEDAPNGREPVWAPILEDDVADALGEHYQLMHGQDVAAAAARVSGQEEGEQA